MRPEYEVAAVRVAKSFNRLNSYTDYIICTENEAMRDCLTIAMNNLLKQTSKVKAYSSLRERVILSDVATVKEHVSSLAADEKLRLICFVETDLMCYEQNEEAQEKTIAYVKSFLDVIPKNRLERTVLAVCVEGDMVPPNDSNYEYAENEYTISLEAAAASSREAFVCKLEKLFSDLAKEVDAAAPKLKKKQLNHAVDVLRIQNLTASDRAIRSVAELRSIVEAGLKNQAVVMQGSEGYRHYTSIRNALLAIFWVLKAARPGHIYQVRGNTVSLGRIGYEIYERLSSLGSPVTYTVDNQTCNSEANLFTMKLRSIGWKPVISEKAMLQELIDPFFDVDFAERDMNLMLQRAYAGKLDLIKRLQMDVMREIDRICRKHDIKYFLVGGSMLGAIRHHGYIPWDDDLDIGMLRPDYEKFRAVCPKELSEAYSYQSYTDEPDSHYIFDKVRMKHTYFSTKFSNRFEIENGIFVDILVYDQTANDEKRQLKHINRVCRWTTIINIRWVNVPRKNIWYRTSKVMLPIMRKIPWKWYHKRFEKAVQMYDHKKDSKFLIDGVGQNIRKGAFPLEWVTETMDVPFEDMMLPVPTGYDEYLRHWYGDNYMDIPPLVNRFSGHSIARLDMGGYLYQDANRYTCDDAHGDLYSRNS